MLRQKSRTLAALILLMALVAAPAAAQTSRRTIPDIPYKRFVLKNGLTLLVHEDRKAPIVAVNVWYHVGSKNEKFGRTGFAHLFEHLMFNGSEHFNQDYFHVLEKIGATDLNGTTNEDRTNYFQNVPTSALDTVLWLESDRMGHLLGAIDQAKLDEQRGVVQNEKRQGENQPYGTAWTLIPENCYPKGHPYSWSVIGSMEDLSAAKLEDVQEWFKTYYGAANAVIVLAGDIDPETARQKVEKYFGEIPSGPPVGRHQTWIAKRTGEQRQVVQDRVPQARIYMVWNVPEARSDENARLDLVTSLLAGGKTSRLYKRLVYKDQIATQVSAFNDAKEIAGNVILFATARPGVPLATVEKAIREEVDRFLKEGPTAEELEGAKTEEYAQFVRGIQRIGGFGGKSDILATSEVYAGNPDAYKRWMQVKMDSTAAQVKKAAVDWLSDGVYVLEYHPFGQYEVSSAKPDRSKMPDPGTPPGLKMPAIQRATLKNGMKVVLAERHDTPLVEMRLLLDAGYAADQFGIPGTASLAMNMLDEGTAKRDSLALAEETERLGMALGTGSNLDQSFVRVNALKANLDASLALMAEVVLTPSFPENELARLKKEQIAGIQREKSQPFTIALRLMPQFMYGQGHAYGNPLTGSGSEESVAKIAVADIRKYYDTWFKADNATLVVVGDTTLAEMTALLEKYFGSWKGGSVPKKNLAQVQYKTKPEIYLVDRPGSLQSVILAGHIAPPRNNPQELAIETMNNILGGMFISRLNMNLREDKHWSYGARTQFVDAQGQRPFIAIAPVQTDKTKESLAEMVKEMRGISGQMPLKDEELDMAKGNMTLSLPGSQETLQDLAAAVADLVRFGWPDDYYLTYASKVQALSKGTIEDAGRSIVKPDALTWVVVGDRAKVEAGIRELNLGEVKVIDADGKPAK